MSFSSLANNFVNEEYFLWLKAFQIAIEVIDIFYSDDIARD